MVIRVLIWIGRDKRDNLSSAELDAQVDVVWIDIWTGERVEDGVDELKFTTGLSIHCPTLTHRVCFI
jgi:hypothetical protein